MLQRKKEPEENVQEAATPVLKLVRQMSEVDMETPEWTNAVAEPTVALLEHLAEASPFPLSVALVPFAHVVGGAIGAVEHVKGNEEEAKKLAQRGKDVALKLHEIVEIIHELEEDHQQVRVRWPSSFSLPFLGIYRPDWTSFQLLTSLYLCEQ